MQQAKILTALELLYRNMEGVGLSLDAGALLERVRSSWKQVLLPVFSAFFSWKTPNPVMAPGGSVDSCAVITESPRFLSLAR